MLKKNISHEFNIMKGLLPINYNRSTGRLVER